MIKTVVDDLGENIFTLKFTKQFIAAWLNAASDECLLNTTFIMSGMSWIVCAFDP